MCVEQFEDGVAIDGKVDVWAAACCVVQMLTGRVPFAGLQIQVREREREVVLVKAALRVFIPALFPGYAIYVSLPCHFSGPVCYFCYFCSCGHFSCFLIALFDRPCCGMLTWSILAS
jgi:hypothetical protein